MAKKILVVDDEPNIRRVVKLVLESGGFDVDTAQDSQECMSKLKEKDPDLVLLDILMPKVPGTSVLQSIMKTRPGTKVIMLSVIQSDFHKQLCKEMGAIGYITKPFNNDDLVQAVKNSISVKKVSMNITYSRPAEHGEGSIQLKKRPNQMRDVRMGPDDIRTVQINAISIIKKQLGMDNTPAIVGEYRTILEPLRKSKSAVHHRVKNN